MSCRETPTVDPLGRVPALLFEGASLRRLLDRTSALADTPAGQATARLRSRLEGCNEVAFVRPEAAGGAEADAAGAGTATAAVATASSAIPGDALVCRDALDLEPALAERLARARGEHAGILQWPVGRTGRIELRFDVDDEGGLALSGRLEPDDAMGAAAFLVPAATPPAAPRIDAERTLVHLHLRSAAGTGLASLVPQDGQADRLFALKGRLLEGALLEGTLELAFVEPAPGGQVPLAVAALHHRGAAPIEAALRETLSQLDRTWSIEPTPRRFPTPDGGGLDGGCYADLPLLPELAPCWVVTSEAILVGYRAEAIETVLGGAPKTASTSGLVVDFDRVRALDRRLVASQVGTEAGALPVRLADLYSRLELHGTSDPDGRVAIEGRLGARP